MAELAGLEVEREDGTTIHRRDLLDPADLSVTRVVSRLEFAALSAHREATSAFVSGADERTGSVERVERRARDAAVEAALVERCFRRTLTDLGVLDRLDPGRSTLLEYLQVAGELERVASLAADLSRAAYGESPPDPSPEALADCAQRTRLSIEHATDAALSDVSLERAREARRCATAVESLASDSPDSRTWFRALDALERTADCATVVGSHAVRSALRREG